MRACRPIYRHNLAVQGFWALRGNIYDRVFTTLDFPVILDGRFTSFFIMFVAEVLIRDFYITKQGAEVKSNTNPKNWSDIVFYSLPCFCILNVIHPIQ
jgi:hypothetical protein